MKQTYFHAFIPKKVSIRTRMNQQLFVFREGGGSFPPIKHLNKNSEGEEESNQIAVKYRSLLPPYRINI